MRPIAFFKATRPLSDKPFSITNRARFDASGLSAFRRPKVVGRFRRQHDNRAGKLCAGFASTFWLTLTTLTEAVNAPRQTNAREQ